MLHVMTIIRFLVMRKLQAVEVRFPELCVYLTYHCLEVGQRLG